MDVYVMIEWVAFTVFMSAIMYPIFGGVMYADPWKWPIKQTEPPQ